MKKAIFFLLCCSISFLSYSEVIRLDCSGYPITIKTFPDSIKTSINVNGKSLDRIEDGWTWKFENFELTDHSIKFIELMIPPSKHKHEWVHSKTFYEIDRFTGSLKMYRRELSGDGKVLSERAYPLDKCNSIKQKF